MSVSLIKQKPQALADLGTEIVGEAEQSLASYLEVDLSASVNVQMERVLHDARQSMEAALRMGLRLLAVRAQCQHGEFERLVREAGIGERDSQSCMRLARAVAAEGDERRRAALLGMGKTKAVLLLSAKPEVRDQILESPELLSEALEGSVRELEALKERVTDMTAQRDTAIAQRDDLAKQLRRQERDAEENGDIPPAVSGLRAEGAALVKKAELALNSLSPLGVDLLNLVGSEAASGYINPSLRLVLSGIVALRVQADGLIQQYADALGDDVHKLTSPSAGLEALDASEIETVVKRWQSLVTAHQMEAEMRENKRANETPGKRGRKRKVVP